MFLLQFEDQVFTSLADFRFQRKDLPDFVQEALSFCGNWIEGKSEFTQQTSGSTGTPKKIQISRSQMESSALSTGKFFQIQHKAQLLCCLNTAYIAGKMMLVRAMVWDCPIRLVPPSSNPLGGLEENFDFVAMVPLQVETSISNAESFKKLQKIRHLIIGGAPISLALQLDIVKNRLNAWQSYGMTETVSHIALAKIGKEELLYEVLPQVKIGQDERGALWVNAEMSQNQQVQTNDLVKFITETSFQWLGRADFVINSGGVKIFPEHLERESESIIHSFFPNCRFFYFGEKDNKLGEKVVLILETERNTEKSALLMDQLKQTLNRFECPKAIYFCPEFSMTENGKISRKATSEKL